jgi:hypothetical protein
MTGCLVGGSVRAGDDGGGVGGSGDTHKQRQLDLRAAARVVEAGELQQAASSEGEEGKTAEEGGLGIMKEAVDAPDG